jgi:muramoyltetrapeptide carboxypeptidase
MRILTALQALGCGTLLGTAIAAQELPADPLKPAGLQSGDIIGLVAPASPLSQELLRAAVESLRRRGYHVKLTPEIHERRGYLAGADESRANAINSLIRDPEVKAIICLRGGYGSPRILDRIDYEALRRRPKPIIGYSDITALLIAVRQQAGIVTFHGPMAREWAMTRGLTPFSEKYYWDLLTRVDSPSFVNWGGERVPGMKAPATLVPGQADGRLTGGNLSVICATLGTPFEIDTRGCILFIEEVGEKAFRIDRMLNQLRLAGKLRSSRGILLGSFAGCDFKDPDGDLSLPEIFADYLGGLGIPVLAEYPAGHIADQALLPLGVLVRLDATQKKLTLLEPAVRAAE